MPAIYSCICFYSIHKSCASTNFGEVHTWYFTWIWIERWCILIPTIRGAIYTNSTEGTVSSKNWIKTATRELFHIGKISIEGNSVISSITFFYSSCWCKNKSVKNLDSSSSSIVWLTNLGTVSFHFSIRTVCIRYRFVHRVWKDMNSLSMWDLAHLSPYLGAKRHTIFASITRRFKYPSISWKHSIIYVNHRSIL